MNLKGVSFGMALGDLDGDGDLDVVYANYQGNVTLLRNDCDAGHSVIISLRGTQTNRFGIGATVKLETETGVQVRPLTLARGALSTSEPILHFGLGNATKIRSLTVDWPSGERQSFTELPADRRFIITESATRDVPAPISAPAPLFVEATDSLRLRFDSRENAVDELVQQRLLPFRQNRRGPAIAVGKLSTHEQDDLVLGGTPLDPLRIVSGGQVASFAASSPTVNDGPVLIFDANGDGRNDLLVTRSGTALVAGASQYQPSLYFAQNDGAFAPAPAGALPSLTLSVGAAAAADFDRDGRLDVFLGARVLPGMYPLAPHTALLQNRGGKFEDVTDSIAPALREIGMVTGAIWSDVDQDGWLDLVLTLDWGGVHYFHNDQGKAFTDWSERTGFTSAGNGWWNGIAAADFNSDGRMDFAVGNVGLNTPYRADAAHPALLFAGDFVGEGAMQLVEAYYEGDKLYPWRARRDLGAAIPAVLKKYPRNDFYARATLAEILGEDKLAAAQRFAATEFQAGVFLSQSDGTYRFSPLPRIAQVAPTQGIVAADFDGDGHADLCLVQNSFQPVPYVGRFDGGLGQFLRGDGRGGFLAVPARESGIVIPGDGRSAAIIDLDRDGWPDLFTTRNNNTTLAFRNAGIAGRHRLTVQLRGPTSNPTAIGARVVLELADGSKETAEVYAGSGYFSQSSATCFFGWLEGNRPQRIRVRWPEGRVTEHRTELSDTALTLSPSD